MKAFVVVVVARLLNDARGALIAAPERVALLRLLLHLLPPLSSKKKAHPFLLPVLLLRSPSPRRLHSLLSPFSLSPLFPFSPLLSARLISPALPVQCTPAAIPAVTFATALPPSLSVFSPTLSLPPATPTRDTLDTPVVSLTTISSSANETRENTAISSRAFVSASAFDSRPRASGTFSSSLCTRRTYLRRLALSLNPPQSHLETSNLNSPSLFCTSKMPPLDL